MVGVDRRKAGLDDEIVDKSVVGVATGVALDTPRGVAIVFGLGTEVGTVVFAGERNVVAVVVLIEVGTVAADRVDITVSSDIVCPTAVHVGHLAEDKLVLVEHVGIEVDMSCASVIAEGRQHM